MRPWRLVIGLLLGAILVGQLIRISLWPGLGTAVTVADLAVGTITIAWIADRLLRYLRTGRLVINARDLTGPDRWLLGFQAILLVTFFLSWLRFDPQETLVGAAYLIRLQGYLSLYWVIRGFKLTNEEFKTVFRAFITTVFILAGAGFFQLIFFPDFQSLGQLGWDPHVNRLASSFLDPNYMSIFLGIGLTLATTLYLFAHPAERKEYGLVIVILWIALYYAYSRSGWAATGIAMSIVGFRRNWLTGTLILAVFVGLLFLPGRFSKRFTDTIATTKINLTSGQPELTSEDDTTNARIASWKKGLTVVRLSPIVGVGYNNFGLAAVKTGELKEKDLKGHSAQGSDASLLNVWATSGLFGLILFSSFLVSLIAPARKLLKGRLSGSSVLYFGFTAALVGLLANSFLINSLFYPPILIFYLIMAGYFRNSVQTDAC